MSKVKLNIASDMTKKLIELLSKLEATEYDKMSSRGKFYLNEIWKLLGMPTHSEMQANKKPNKDEEE